MIRNKKVALKEKDVFEIWSKRTDMVAHIDKITTFIDNGIMETNEGTEVLKNELNKHIEIADSFYSHIYNICKNEGIKKEISFDLDFVKRNFVFDEVEDKFNKIDFAINSLELSGEFDKKVRELIE